MSFTDDKTLLRELLAECRSDRVNYKTYLDAPTDLHEKLLRLEQLGVATRADHQDSPNSVNWKVHYSRAQDLYASIVKDDEQSQQAEQKLEPTSEPYDLYKKYGGPLGGQESLSIMRQQELFNAIGPVAATARELLGKLHKAIQRLESIEKSISSLREDVKRKSP